MQKREDWLLHDASLSPLTLHDMNKQEQVSNGNKLPQYAYLVKNIIKISNYTSIIIFTISG